MALLEIGPFKQIEKPRVVFRDGVPVAAIAAEENKAWSLAICLLVMYGVNVEVRLG